MNAILGSGILGLSYAMAQLGILCFFIICGGVAALAFYAIVLMLNMCKKTGAKVILFYKLVLNQETEGSNPSSSNLFEQAFCQDSKLY